VPIGDKEEKEGTSKILVVLGKVGYKGETKDAIGA